MNEAVHLQSIGSVPARRVDTLAIGDGILYNFGIVGIVTDIKPSKSGKTMTITTRYKSGKEYSARMSAKTLVGKPPDNR